MGARRLEVVETNSSIGWGRGHIDQFYKKLWGGRK